MKNNLISKIKINNFSKIKDKEILSKLKEYGINKIVFDKKYTENYKIQILTKLLRDIDEFTDILNIDKNISLGRPLSIEFVTKLDNDPLARYLFREDEYIISFLLIDNNFFTENICHEWFHHLDRCLCLDICKLRYASNQSYFSETNIEWIHHEKLSRAFNNIKSTDNLFVRESKLADEYYISDGYAPYYGTPPEILARSFETYLINKTGNTDLLIRLKSKYDEYRTNEYRNDEKAIVYKFQSYPQSKEDINTICKNIDSIFDNLKTIGYLKEKDINKKDKFNEINKYNFEKDIFDDF